MNGKGLKTKLFLSARSNIICLGLVLETLKPIIIILAQWKLQALDIQSKEMMLLPQAATIIIYQQSEFFAARSHDAGIKLF